MGDGTGQCALIFAGCRYGGYEILTGCCGMVPVYATVGVALVQDTDGWLWGVPRPSQVGGDGRELYRTSSVFTLLVLRFLMLKVWHFVPSLAGQERR